MKIAMMTDHIARRVGQEEAIKEIAAIGYDAVDISYFGCMDDNDEMMKGDYLGHAKHLKEVCDKVGIVPVQAHSPFPIHRDGDEEWNDKMVKVTEKVLRSCAILGIKNCVVHPWNNWDAERNKEWFDQFLPLCEELGVTICTENMFNWDNSKDIAALAACSTPEDFLRHCETVNHKNFKACVDIGHASMFPHLENVSPAKMIKTLGNKYVRCLHVHDNDLRHDCHNSPFRGNVDWEKVIEALQDIGYDGDLVVETTHRNDAPLEIIIAYAKFQLVAMKYLRDRILENHRNNK